MGFEWSGKKLSHLPHQFVLRRAALQQYTFYTLYTFCIHMQVNFPQNVNEEN